MFGNLKLNGEKKEHGEMTPFQSLATAIAAQVGTGNIQVRKFGEGFRLVFGNLKLNGEKKEHGEMTPFQSLATAIAAQVGTGNLTGAATALLSLSGGPGAIFWMWLSAFFGMATIYSEATLAQKYKTVVDGEVTGGPVYYIRAAFTGKFGKILAATFSVLIILALGFMGNMVQSNSIGAAFSEVFASRNINIPPITVGLGNMVQSNSIGAAFSEVFASRNINIPPITVGLLIAVVAGFVFIGGTQILASVVEKIVPIMAFVYIIGSLALIGMNISEVPEAFKMIIVGAFNPKAVLGGAVGISIKEAIRYGVARGLFSNEAGMGSTPHAHARAAAKNPHEQGLTAMVTPHAHARAAAKNPHEQGLTAMVSVFIDTFIILNLTAFSILTSGVLDSGKEGIALTQTAFVNTFGSGGDIFIAVCLLFFAFSTILGWHFFGRINVKYLFGQKAVKIYSLIVILFIIVGSTLKFFGRINVKYLFGQKAVKIYSLIVILFIIVGSTLKVELVWQLADCFNGLMVIPNAIALFALSGVVMGIYKKYVFIIVGSTLKVELVWQLADCFNGLMVIPNAIALFALSGVVMGIYKKYVNGDSDKDEK